MDKKSLSKKQLNAIIAGILAVAVVITSVVVIPKIIKYDRDKNRNFDFGAQTDITGDADETLFEFLNNKPDFTPGKSKAFKTAPVAGLTISAEENALDYDAPRKTGNYGG